MTAKKVFVTGAAGRTGSHTLKWLSQQGSSLDVCAGIHKGEESRQEAVLKNMNVKPCVVEAKDKKHLMENFRDVQDLFIIPSAADDKVEIAKHYIDAARESGVKFILLLSVWGADKADYTWGKQFNEIEEYLKKTMESDSWCILRTNFYADNILLYADQIKQGYLPLPTGQGRFAPVDLDDVGLAAKEILMNCQAHKGKTYVLTGPEALNGQQMAEKMSQVMGKQITFKDIEPEEAHRILKSQNIPESEIRGFLDFYRLAKNNEVTDVSHDFQTILKRSPHKIDEFVSACKTELVQ